jgi:hypothetical protein
MAKKKVAKKAAKKAATKKATMKQAPSCSNEDCKCMGLLALLIIILTWWKPAEMWAQITITVLAAIILLSGNKCYCKG